MHPVFPEILLYLSSGPHYQWSWLLVSVAGLNFKIYSRSEIHDSILIREKPGNGRNEKIKKRNRKRAK